MQGVVDGCSSSRISLVLAFLALIAFCLVTRLLRPLERASAEAQRRSRAEARQPQASRSRSDSQNIVAVVDQSPIHRNYLARECLRRFGGDVIESLINKQILLDECQRQGVVVTAQEVNDEIKSMAVKFNLPPDRWLKMLEDERNIKPQQYRSDIVWTTLALRKLANQSINVSEEDFKQAFDSQYGPKVRVRMIAVALRQKAEEIQRQAAAQPDKFASLAMDHSEDKNTAPYGGMVPPIRLHMGNAELERAAFQLQPGEVSSVIPIANQFIILKCEKHLPPIQISPQDMKIIRSRLEDRIRNQKQREVAATTFSRLRDAVQVENVFNNPQLSQKMPGVAARVNGKQITVRHLAEECILRHGESVLEIEINRRLLQQELDRRKLRVLDSDIDREIDRAARAFGITNQDGSADIQRWKKMVAEEEGVPDGIYETDFVWPTVALKKLVGSRVKVTEEDLKKGFEANYGERVECLAIVLSDQRRAQELWRKAKDNPTDEYFGKLAANYSIESVSRNNNGKTPPIARYSGQPVVEKAAFELEKGKMSGIIAVSEDRYIILRCLGRTQPVTQHLASVQELLHEDILEKKMRDAMAKEFDRLKEAAQIDNFLAQTSQEGKRNTIPMTRKQARKTQRPRSGRVAPATATQPIRR